MENFDNLVSLSEMRAKKMLKSSLNGYKEYLSSLPFNQLPFEISYLIDDFKAHQYGQDYFMKGQLVLQELAMRSTDERSKKIIEKMGPELALQIKKVFGVQPSL